MMLHRVLPSYDCLELALRGLAGAFFPTESQLRSGGILRAAGLLPFRVAGGMMLDLSTRRMCLV